VPLSAEERRQRFHHYGPWTVVLLAAAIAIGVEANRHHTFNSIEVCYFAVLIPSIILHEVSHGFVANLCGDDTAKNAGRLTLNPLRHIDPFGTLILPALLILFGGPAFGWAKPVPVSVNRLRHPRNQSLLVSLAGPAVNIVLSIIAGLALSIWTHHGATLNSSPNLSIGVQLLFVLGVANVIIAVFNLIPIPPLDGSAVLERFLPASLLPGYYRLRQYAMLLVFALVIFKQGLLSSLFGHVLNDWQHLWIPQY
jgi:Zn-dependent protease